MSFKAQIIDALKAGQTVPEIIASVGCARGTIDWVISITGLRPRYSTPNHKRLSKKDRLEVLDLLRNTDKSQIEIARQFGVSGPAIWKIKKAHNVQRLGP